MEQPNKTELMESQDCKDTERAEIERLTQEYLKRGGQITVIPTGKMAAGGFTKEAQDMRNAAKKRAARKAKK